jgi:uncharacterized protein
MALTNYIGKGLVFPVVINSKGSVDLSTGFDLINSSIKMILTWGHTRILLKEFVSILENLLEEPNDPSIKQLAEFFVYDSLRKWEKRIEVIDTFVNILDTGVTEISIHYKLKSSNIEELLTFPFYKNLTY